MFLPDDVGKGGLIQTIRRSGSNPERFFPPLTPRPPKGGERKPPAPKGEEETPDP